MNITHYFFKFGYNTSLKNNLQKEVYSYLKALDLTLIDAEEVKPAQEIIIDEINKINAKHPRCKALNVSFWDRSSRESEPQIALSGFPEVIFQIYPAQLKHLTALPYRSLSNN